MLQIVSSSAESKRSSADIEQSRNVPRSGLGGTLAGRASIQRIARETLL